MADLPDPHPLEDPNRSRLTDNVVHFARLLRRAGLPVGPASVVDAVQALAVSGVSSRGDVYWTLHSIFVTRRDHHLLFDEAFRTFWRSRGLVEKMIAMMSPVAPPRAPEPPKAGAARLAHALFGDSAADRTVERPEIEIDARLTVSDREILQTKDFAQMSAAEIAAAVKAVRDLVMPVDTVPTRRRVPHARGREIDMRGTLRASLRTGGALIPLTFRAPKTVHPPIVALLDISGSMSQYSRLFLHFLHALSTRRKVSTFLFGTRLTNVTRQLALKDPDEALIACSSHVADWSGGTRIGEAIHRFNKDWSRRVLSGGPIVLLITDGLERDDVGGLSREMDRLHRSCRRLIWLNPLLRYSAFEAKAQGIKLMLPHVDEFRPVHNLSSMEGLIAALSAPPPPHHMSRIRSAA